MDIKLNFDDVIEEMTLTKVQAQDMSKFVVEQLTTHIHANWQNQARKNLKSTRQAYIEGLRIIEEGRFKNAIVLFGRLNNMLEQGASPFDMKIGFLSSKKIKYTKEGKPYITIPFRHGVPSSLGENQAFSGTMPQEVYTAMQKLQKEGRDTMTSKDIPKGFETAGVREMINKSDRAKQFNEYRHKSSIYSGMTNTGDAGHSQYMTFRRVSLASDALAWIHRGFQPRNFAQRAIEESDIEESVEIFIDKYLEKL